MHRLMYINPIKDIKREREEVMITRRPNLMINLMSLFQHSSTKTLACYFCISFFMNFMLDMTLCQHPKWSLLVRSLSAQKWINEHSLCYQQNMLTHCDPSPRNASATLDVISKLQSVVDRGFKTNDVEVKVLLGSRCAALQRSEVSAMFHQLLYGLVCDSQRRLQRRKVLFRILWNVFRHLSDSPTHSPHLRCQQGENNDG